MRRRGEQAGLRKAEKDNIIAKKADLSGCLRSLATEVTEYIVLSEGEIARADIVRALRDWDSELSKISTRIKELRGMK